MKLNVLMCHGKTKSKNSLMLVTEKILRPNERLQQYVQLI